MKKTKRSKAIELHGDVSCVTTTELSDNIAKEMAVWEIMRSLREFHKEADKKLCEIKEMCTGNDNEQ